MIGSSGNESGGKPEAERVFEQYLERWCRGETVDFREYVVSHPSLAADLQSMFSSWERMLSLMTQARPDGRPAADAAGSERGTASIGDRDQAKKVISALADASRSDRYKVIDEVARGGMGIVLRVRDEELRRDLAMKVMRTRPEWSPEATAAKSVRFLEEAQVTGQLDHPGIVPVYELGRDSEGQLYFTMRLVRGHSLQQVFEMVHEKSGEWTQVRALGVMMKVCEAMAFAHSKKVIHRDLKPANIMVGRFGETYVMDWGLARVMSEADRHDIRPQVQPVVAPSVVHTQRDDARSSNPNSPLLTMDGDVIGTPSYMAPEQAKGLVHEIGPRSDVYSVGAMLYHLVTGKAPYTTAGTNLTNELVLACVINAPPERIQALSPGTPPELIAISEKAMARSPKDRYPDMLAMAEDLRAFLENRVVNAYRRGAIAEFRKWVARNRGMAGALLGIVAMAVVGLLAAALIYRDGRERANDALLKVRRLADQIRLDQLQTSQAELWPARPQKIEALRSWLAEARRLVANLPDHERTLAELQDIRGMSPENAWLHQQNQELVKRLGDLERGDDFGSIPSMERRLHTAESIQRETVDAYSAAWTEAARVIESDPRFDGLELAPQIGLVPIGPDPESNLYEFLVWGTGTAPVRDPGTNRQRVDSTTGIMLVLVPPGDYVMGASNQIGGVNYSPKALDNEAPPHQERVEAYFISKYEMTQAQWLRIMGSNPSIYREEQLGAKTRLSGSVPGVAYPVENVSWSDAAEAMRRLALELPSESQWEYIDRAGTSSPWWTGDVPRTLFGAANIADLSFRGIEHYQPEPPADWEDGYAHTSPVGVFRANGFGLHDTIGNVWEWTRDYYRDYDHPEPDGRRVARGGGCRNAPSRACSASRWATTENARSEEYGLRPSRSIDP